MSAFPQLLSEITNTSELVFFWIVKKSLAFPGSCVAASVGTTFVSTEQRGFTNVPSATLNGSMTYASPEESRAEKPSQVVQRNASQE
jgi:hypothetical protein